MRIRKDGRMTRSIIVAFSVVSLAYLVFTPIPALAADCSTFNFYLDGASTGASTNTIGTTARIGHYRPRIPCQMSAAWVMVDTHAGTHSFAQVGWERGLISGDKTRFFIEYSLCSH